MSDIDFINGLIVKAPNDKAPDFVKARLSIKREELIAWLQGRDGEWINADIKVSKAGKWFCAVDTWKPNQGGERTERKPASAPARDESFDSDSIPF